MDGVGFPIFDGVPMTSYSTLTETTHLSRTVFKFMVSYLSKVADFNLPHLPLSSLFPVGDDPI